MEPSIRLPEMSSSDEPDEDLHPQPIRNRKISLERLKEGTVKRREAMYRSRPSEEERIKARRAAEIGDSNVSFNDMTFTSTKDQALARDRLREWFYHEQQMADGHSGSDETMLLPVHIYLRRRIELHRDFFIYKCPEERQRHFELAFRGLTGDVPLPEDPDMYHYWMMANPALVRGYGLRKHWLLDLNPPRDSRRF